jgi:nucleoside phosphorylase/CheY-like chemotaxis protein
MAAQVTSESAPESDRNTQSTEIVVVTAVEVELQAVLLRLTPPSGSGGRKRTVGANTYYFGTIGRYRCAVVMAEKGSGGTAGSALVVSDAIDHLDPQAIIMVGIAFGRDESSQQLGDLLVAKQVIPYELQRLGLQVVPRAAHPEAGPLLLDRARNLSWVRQSADGPGRGPIFGALLSGEKLVDDETVKRTLFSLFPQAIGGEMEAAGVAAACQRRKREWLVAKSICDWADGKKSASFQEMAASIAADFLGALLNEGGLTAATTTSSPRVNRPDLATPSTPDEERRAAIRADLDSAYEERERLVHLGQDTTEIDKFILDLKRQFREGGQLHAGDFLCEGRYRLVTEVGSGGFATVWRAWNRVERQLVALKVLHPQCARDESRRERFFRGAKKMSELHHRAVVSVISSREVDAGWFFFVMEFLPLGDLHRAVSSGEVSADSALEVVLTAAEGLQAAHEAGMVHRDVCPPNILVREGGTGVLTDFDLVRAFNTTGGTRTGAMGRFVYTAPEAMNNAAEVGPVADVYSLGMSSLFAVLGHDVPPEVVRDSRIILREANCSTSVQRVIERAISWRPEHRFQTVREFVHAMKTALSAPIRTGRLAGELEGRAVLVVDDEKFIRDILKDFIGMEGATTFTADSHVGAREIVERHAIDVAVIDVKLDPDAHRRDAPDTGLGLLRELRALPFPPTCVMMTGFGSVPIALEAMKAGAFDFIEKPFKVEEIIRVVTLACRGR